MAQDPAKVHPPTLTHKQAEADLAALDAAVQDVWRHRWEGGPRKFATAWILERATADLPPGDISIDALDEVAQAYLNTLHDDHAYVMAAGEVLGRINEPSTPVHFRKLDPEIGLLRIDRFPEPDQPYGERFPGMIDEAFAALKDTKGLILDLRNNAGGDPNQTDRLFEHFTSTTVFLYYEVVRRSEAMKRYLGEEKYGRWKWAQGGQFSEPYAITFEPEQPRAPYRGKVLALADQGTVSAGEYFLAELVDNKFARAAGERTPGHTGSIVPVELPHSKLVIAMPIQHVLRKNLTTLQHKGVVPQYPLDPDAPDILERAAAILRQWIAEGK